MRQDVVNTPGLLSGGTYQHHRALNASWGSGVVAFCHLHAEVLKPRRDWELAIQWEDHEPKMGSEVSTQQDPLRTKRMGVATLGESRHGWRLPIGK
jgi:hypothetical protein